MNRVPAVRRPVRGLTLIELMVVVAIMAIIGTVAYPVYTNQMQKTRRADAKSALEMIALAQERFYTLNGAYTDQLANLAPLQLPADIAGGTSEQGLYTVAIAFDGGPQRYTATAVPAAGSPQADDGYCTQFTLNHAGLREAQGSQPDKCW